MPGLMSNKKTQGLIPKISASEGTKHIFKVAFRMDKFMNLCTMHKFVHENIESLWAIDILI